MPRDGQGQYSPPLSNWNPAVDGNEADPAGWNQYRDDVSAAISQSVSADGQTLMTGPLKMGGQRIQSLAAPTGNGHALRRDQLIKGANIASASTIDIPNEGSLFEITGTATIEHITGAFDGRLITLLFQDELIIKNGLDIALPLGVDIKTNPGLMLQFQRIENNKWSIVSYPEATETAPGIQPKIDYDIMKWLSTPIGWLREAWHHIPGTETPPTDNPSFRYIRLTASDPYNAGVLINETVSGTAPTITASAEINLPGSPLHGSRVPLINTSRPFLRPGGDTGAIFNSQNKSHTHLIVNNRSTGAFISQLPGSGTTSIALDSMDSWPEGGDEANPRFIGATYYLRIM